MKDKIAIIGTACSFAKSPSSEQFWNNIKNGVDGIGILPTESRWGKGVYLPNAKPSLLHSYCNRGGVIDFDIDFDPLEYSMIPNELSEIDPDHLLALKLAKQALNDAGINRYGNNLTEISCGIILGKVTHVGPVALKAVDVMRTLPQLINILKNSIPNIDEKSIESFKSAYIKEKGDFESSKGISLISNLSSARISDRLNLNGPSYVLDAACASSHIAVQNAVRELQTGNTDIMIAGGVYYPINYPYSMGFSFLNALSHKGKISPFDKSADGLLLGEGGGMIVLKRLEDAVSNNDKVLAVIESIESNNDGKGTSILAPLTKGQINVIKSTWEKPNIDPSKLTFVECHGTGMPLGDTSEINALNSFFGDYLKSPTPIGSVKSMIGHTLSSAGIAGIIKAVHALNERQIPPSLNCTNPIELLTEGLFYIQNKLTPYKDKDVMYAAVNAFGFGGVNSHIILSSVPLNKKIVQESTHFKNIQKTKLERRNDTLLITKSSIEELKTALITKNYSFGNNGPVRLAIINPTESKFQEALKIVEKNRTSYGKNDIFFKNNGLLNDSKNKLAVLFPGISVVGTNNDNYIDVANNYNIDISKWTHNDTNLDKIEKLGVYSIISSLTNFKILEKEGIHVDTVAGYSIGEYTALMASGLIKEKDVQGILSSMGRLNQKIDFQQNDCTLLAISKNKEVIKKIIHDLDDAFIAIENSTTNVIVSVSTESKKRLSDRLKKEKILFFDIGIKTRNHTIINKPLINSLKPIIDALKINAPSYNIWSSITTKKIKQDHDVIKDVIYRNLFSQVKFKDLIQNLYEDGHRVFLIPGISGLSGYINDTLKNNRGSFLTIDMVSTTKDIFHTIDHSILKLFVEGATIPDIESKFSKYKKNKNLIKFNINQSVNESIDTSLHFNLPLNESTFNQEINFKDDSLGNIFKKTQQNFIKAQIDVIKSFKENEITNNEQLTNLVIEEKDEPELLAFFEEKIEISYKAFPELFDHELYRHPKELAEKYRSGVVPFTFLIYKSCELLISKLKEYNIVKVSKIVALRFLSVGEPKQINITFKKINKKQFKITWEDNFFCTVDIALKINSLKADISDWATGMTNVNNYNPYKERVFFHGKSYQGIENIKSYDPKRLVAEVKHAGGYGSLLDACFQAAGCWYDFTQNDNALVLPFRVDSIEFFTSPATFFNNTLGPLYCKVSIKELSDEYFKYDFDLVYKNSVLLRLKGFIGKIFETNPEIENVYRYPEKHTSILSKKITDTIFIFDTTFKSAWSWDTVRSFYLNNNERERFDKIKNPLQQRAFLYGRVAIKDGIKSLKKAENHNLFHNEIEVVYNKNRAPFINIQKLGITNIPVSISHKEKIGVAIIGSNNSVGIDVEYISEVGKLDSKLVFTNSELNTIKNTKIPALVKTIIWSAKEAYFKKYSQEATEEKEHLIFNNIEVSNIKLDTEKMTAYKCYSGLLNKRIGFTSIQYKENIIITWINK